MSRSALGGIILSPVVTVSLLFGCRSAGEHRRQADEAAAGIIEQKQLQAYGEAEPVAVESPSDTLRRRLMLGQDLPYSHPGSLSVYSLEPTQHWPRDNYLSGPDVPPDPTITNWGGEVLELGLMDALQVAAYNSQQYRAQKEAVFIEALNLDLERDEFRATFTGLVNSRIIADLGGDDLTAGVVTTPQFSVTQRLKSGAAITGRIAVDLLKLLTMDRPFSRGITADASATVPLLRGAGEHIVAEPLTQAERNVIYSLYEFEQFRRNFAVTIATQYLAVLQQLDRLQNVEESYRSAIISSRRVRRQADAGRLTALDVGQALQRELSVRDQWIAARQGYAEQLDSFKVLLGLPPDAQVVLNRAELQRLVEAFAPAAEDAAGRDILEPATTRAAPPATRPNGLPEVEPPPAGPFPETAEAATRPALDLEEIDLEEPTMAGAGPYEIPEAEAIRLAMENRPDLKVAQGEVYDAQRRVVVAADALRAGLTLTANAAMGSSRRGLGSAQLPNAQLRPDEGLYDAGLLLDLPLERTRERNIYRTSLISLERAVRSLQDLEDRIKLALRNLLRDLLQARESLKTQARAVEVARGRVTEAKLRLEAGRLEVRDLVEAENALLDAQNAFTRAVVNYRVAELQLQRELGVLEVSHGGIWREYIPEERQ